MTSRLTPSDASLETLHDVEIDRIECKLSDRTVTIKLRGHELGWTRIEASEVSEIQIGARSPWGRSSAINSAQLTTLEDVGFRLVIEMQSGDNIVVIAGAFALSRSPH